MKRILSVLMVLSVLLTFCACGGNKDRELYDTNLKKYVELGDYSDLKLDTKSDAFKKNYDELIASDISNNSLYKEKKEGKIEKGDVANIDYVGKKEGVAFDGGTAEGYDLEIGSGSFIDGFEDGLIGVAVGSTVNLNLTFPENYGNEELNGAKVVFTVTVNYIREDKTPEEYYADLGFASVEDYYKDINETACEWTLTDMAVEKCKIKDYPKEDYEFLLEKTIELYETQVQSSYGMDLDTYLQYMSQSREDFEEQVGESEVKPSMDSQMKLYAIFDKEKLELKTEDVDARIKEIVDTINKDADSSSKVTEKDVTDYYGRYYFENLIVTEKVSQFLYKNATIS